MKTLDIVVVEDTVVVEDIVEDIVVAVVVEIMDAILRKHQLQRSSVVIGYNPNRVFMKTIAASHMI
jgi:hypothetical protein